jgi:Holliday junction resolvasome RuvABC ATP-dependent DNA helicase subunit
MMKRDQLASESLATWTMHALREGERSLARQELPELDLPAFFRAFSNVEGLPNKISLALVGFGVDVNALKSMARKVGATCFSAFASDLHVAASWRNSRARHPIIIAYARGTVTGVNTLRHFAQATSRDLNLTLLRWAASQRLFTTTPAHTRLLQDLQTLVEDDDVFSFEQVRAFLETWSSISGANAPRSALPALGLLPDPNLFADFNLMRIRLEQNLQFMNMLRDRSTGQMESVRKRLLKAAEDSGNRKDASTRLRTFNRLQTVRRNPTDVSLSALTLDEALKVFASPAQPENSHSYNTGDEEADTRTLNQQRLQKASAESLLDDKKEELEKNAEALSKALREALEEGEESGDEDHWQSELEVSGQTHTFQAELDRRFVGWVRHFCKNDVWGGIVETSIPDLHRALDDFDRPDTKILNPENLIFMRGEELGITKLLRGWEDILASKTKEAAELVPLWMRMKTLRSRLLASLEELTHFPLQWFAGKHNIRDVAEDYLKTTGQLFGLVAANYGAMAQNEPSWAQTTLEGLLALDVVQARITQQDGKSTFKAVLLPTHPLHLWRYWRLSNLLRGLGKQLNEADRRAVIEEASDPIQFLSVIYASPLPAKRGGARILPVANDLHQLATFENLQNAYNGPDGQATLVYGVERFAASHRQHVNPLRLVLVNPPQPGTLLLELIRLLDGPKKSLISRLHISVRGTPLQAARLREALLFDTREREIIEEKIASGDVDLLLDRAPKPLDDILTELKTRPAHIVAVFDEAPVSVRRGGVGDRLPMSPFCVRRKIAYHRLWNELRLEPTAGDPPFFEFIELVKHIEGNEGEGTPYAWPEAEALQKSVDGVLTADDFGSQWFYLADRALPEEGEMRAKRLIRRREGQRQVLLAARDYEPIARLMLAAFERDTPNLLMPLPRLQELLAEGAHLIGAGLLDVVKSQEGRVIPTRVIGLMGTLLCARDYLRRHPGALLVSTDSQLARTWLRLGTQGDRCDLFAVREEGARIVVECIEVKTTKGKPRSQSEVEISRACEQLAATLVAVKEGLGDTTRANDQGHYLAAPRNEMLKEVLVQGCMGRFASKAERSRWADWLKRLFGPTPEMPDLQGTVQDVALGSAEEAKSEEFVKGDLTVRLRHLNEIDVQRLLEPATGIELRSEATETSDSLTETTEEICKLSFDPSSDKPPSVPERAQSFKAVAVQTENRKAETSSGKVPSKVPVMWPPSENVFGLIGQEAAAIKLNNKAALASGTGRRFTDTLFIGPAGVGKSSLARAIANKLLAEEPIFFSGTDLPQPTGLIAKLRERGKIPARPRTHRAGRVRVRKCLIFIDEVHALGKVTATALLSAMDDARIGTIGGVEYDFGDVVFIAATTDKGLLTDAFVSRMDIIALAAYTLEELAGIIWHHAKKLFGGYELPREVCIEVAARSRCNPRRAVRSLENDLLAEFYSRLNPRQRRQKNAERAAAALITVDRVATYYDTHGIDLNGLDELGRRTLAYLKTHGSTSEDRLCRALRISNRIDFVELIEYLTRLALLSTGHQGRQLTPEGRRYLNEPTNLRDRI